jgi:hypothetical protein
VRSWRAGAEVRVNRVLCPDVEWFATADGSEVNVVPISAYQSSFQSDAPKARSSREGPVQPREVLCPRAFDLVHDVLAIDEPNDDVHNAIRYVAPFDSWHAPSIGRPSSRSSAPVKLLCPSPLPRRCE